MAKTRGSRSRGTDSTDDGYIRVHLLDVGPQEYADALVCQFGARTVMIDGAHPADHRGREGHPSIPEQLDQLLGAARPHRIDLLIVSHAHQDHIGCLPKLVEDDIVRFEWALVADPDLGWGRATGEDRDSSISDSRVRDLVAALRDECAPLSPSVSDARIQEFVADAVILEDSYRDMLRRLEDRGTTIVRLGQAGTDGDTRPLERAFSDVGLQVLGASTEQVLRCADRINGGANDAAVRVADLFSADAALTAADAYRRLIDGDLDMADASRLGAAVNLQSVVTSFDVRGNRFLFAGDMQFEDPQVNDADIHREVQALRHRVSGLAPFSLVKLSHHGSNNAFSEQILSELGGTALFGICAGEHSTRHPNPATLQILHRHRNDIQWARTDRNGLVTMTFGAGVPQIQLTQGRLNDERSNAEDIPILAQSGGVTRPGGARTSEVAARVASTAGRGEVVEVRAMIPHVDTRVTITVEVAPGPRGGVSRAATISGERPSDTFRIGDGRRMPRLLCVTCSATLARNIGQAETERVLAMIEATAMPFCDLPPDLADAVTAARHVRHALSGNEMSNAEGVAGVLLIGGHDVVPHHSVDCLPADVRARVAASEDPDRFIVWSDDIYGDRDGDELAELPVSRIPDGKSADLVLNGLRANALALHDRAGIRNVARPFAQPLFDAITGAGAMLVSQPTVFDQAPIIDLNGDQLYLMLHGDYVDSSRFWGEETADNREAMNISNLPSEMRGIVFTGCCWGALTVDTPAGLAVPGRSFGVKTPESSLALAALARGALAFVGCTGAHYSPTERPYDYFGGPMHRAFWRNSAEGLAPAPALFQAKIDYLAGMPHGRTGPAQTAIEYKILRQYTCIGLGW